MELVGDRENVSDEIFLLVGDSRLHLRDKNNAAYIARFFNSTSKQTNRSERCS